MSSLVTRASRVRSRPPRLLWIVGHMMRVRSCTQTCGASHTNYRVSALFLPNTAVLSLFSSVFGWQVDTSLVCRLWIKCELFSQMRLFFFSKQLLMASGPKHPSFVLIFKTAKGFFLVFFVVKPPTFLLSLWCKTFQLCSVFSLSPFFPQEEYVKSSLISPFSLLLWTSQGKLMTQYFSGGLGEPKKNPQRLLEKSSWWNTCVDPNIVYI